jgi:hypothetical protein
VSAANLINAFLEGTKPSAADVQAGLKIYFSALDAAAKVADGRAVFDTLAPSEQQAIAQALVGLLMPEIARIQELAKEL